MPNASDSRFSTIDLLMSRNTHVLVALVLLSGPMVGCHRQFYRNQVDNEVHGLIAEKSRDVARPPAAPVRLQLDRRSRMFNPFDPDFQPLPLDDPASYRYMQCVDGRRGYPMWEAAGITNTAESPDWWQFLPLDEDGVLVLNAENAVRIALLHSPVYQFQVEQLYLSALDVSAQRFEFDTQFFGGLGTSVTGRGGRGPSYQWGNNNLQMRRNFAWGGSLVTNVANSIVWDLSGPGSTRTGTSLIDFTLLQPLLRNAGRDVVLEQLTSAERNLLADVRSFERFRRSFFLNITIGRGLESQLGGNVVRINPNAGIGGANGFLGLLQTQLQIRNTEENIARQTENLLIQRDTLIELLTTIPDQADSIIRQRLQVAQSEQRLLSQQNSLVLQQAGYQRAVDAFLRDLGLPPYICVRLDDPILKDFELIDSDLLNRRKQLSAARTEAGAINVKLLDLVDTKIDPVTGLPQDTIQWTPELQEMLKQLRAELEPIAELNQSIVENDLPVVRADVAKLKDSLPQREEQIAELLDFYRREQSGACGLLGLRSIDERIFDLTALGQLDKRLSEGVTTLEGRYESYQGRLETLLETLDELTSGVESQDADPAQLARTLADDVILASQDMLSELGEDVLVLQLIQARARTESVNLPSINIEPEQAFEIARKNRRDVANARANLVDAWRQIEVVADRLESDLDLTFSGELGNVDGVPWKLSNRNGNIRVGLRWDAPLTRILERNDYRSTLINYDRARRDYYDVEDSLWQLVRSEIRQLQANRINFELGRQAILSAATQVDLNSDIRALAEARGTQSGPTAARDAIDALNDLLNAQNSLLSIFVNFEVIRRGLDFDLGTMELTPDGLWIDPGEIEPEILLSMPGTTSDGLIECECNDCGFIYNPLPPEPSFRQPMQRVDFEQILSIEEVETAAAPRESSERDGEQAREEIPLPSAEELPPPAPNQDGILPAPVHVEPLPLDSGLLESR